MLTELGTIHDKFNSQDDNISSVKTEVTSVNNKLINIKSSVDNYDNINSDSIKNVEEAVVTLKETADSAVNRVKSLGDDTNKGYSAK